MSISEDSIYSLLNTCDILLVACSSQGCHFPPVAVVEVQTKVLAGFLLHNMSSHFRNPFINAYITSKWIINSVFKYIFTKWTSNAAGFCQDIVFPKSFWKNIISKSVELKHGQKCSPQKYNLNPKTVKQLSDWVKSYDKKGAKFDFELWKNFQIIGELLNYGLTFKLQVNCWWIPIKKKLTALAKGQKNIGRQKLEVSPCGGLYLLVTV